MIPPSAQPGFVSRLGRKRGRGKCCVRLCERARGSPGEGGKVRARHCCVIDRGLLASAAG
jgi:hypothetical protein